MPATQEQRVRRVVVKEIEQAATSELRLEWTKVYALLTGAARGPKKVTKAAQKEAEKRQRALLGSTRL